MDFFLRHIRWHRLLSLLVGMVSMTSHAQTLEEIEVAQGASYTDHIALATDTRDTDMMVKFRFDEAKNTLTVSLISYRRLFVFREDTRYAAAFKGKRLLPERLPFVTEDEPGSRFRLSKPCRKSIPRPRRRHIFRRWIDVKGLQPQPATYHLVNDYIEQTFDIEGRRTAVRVTLHDIFLLDQTSDRPGKARYVLQAGSHLNKTYAVTIRRNPCFGYGSEVETACATRDSLAEAYTLLNKNFQQATVPDQETLELFEHAKASLIEQFPARPVKTDCPDLQEAWDEYNRILEDLRAMRREVAPIEEEKTGIELTAHLEDIARSLLVKARQIDNAVAHWLVSDDEMERKDLIALCKEICDDVNQTISERGYGRIERLRTAVQTFQEAERYFKTQCKSHL